MNADVMKGKWAQLKGSVRTEWGKLTDDDVAVIGGEKDKLLGKLQERYGYAKDHAEKAVDAWISNADGKSVNKPSL